MTGDERRGRELAEADIEAIKRRTGFGDDVPTRHPADVVLSRALGEIARLARRVEALATTGQTETDRLRVVFERGIELGSHYPEYRAIPEAERDIQFRALLDALDGRIWGPADWLAARRPGGSPNDSQTR